LQAIADRYTYLPSIGIFIAVVWAAAEWAGDNHRWTQMDTDKRCALNRGLPGLARGLTLAARHFNYVE